MKQIYIFLMCLIASVSMNAQDKVVTIDNQTPGWLSSKMTYAQQVAVEELTVTGYINPTDMEFINGLVGQRRLRVLNLYDVNVINDKNRDYNLWDGFVDYTGYDNKTLQKLILPRIVKNSTLLLANSNSCIDTISITCNKNLKLKSKTVPKYLIITEGDDSIPSFAFGFGRDYHEGCDVAPLPNNIKYIDGAAFLSDYYTTAPFTFEYPFSFPDSIRVLAKYNDEYAWWSNGYVGYAGSVEMPIDSIHFSFPDSLISYEAEKHVFSSDTITVGKACQNLNVKLHANVALFYAATPPTQTFGYYYIDTLYVPEGASAIYGEKYHSTYIDNKIKKIVEMKALKAINLCYTSPHLMQPDEQIELLSGIQPADAFDKRIKWSSNNEEVATVDANGTVYAHKSGTAIITATTYDGSVSNSCEIIVSKPVTGVSVEPAEVELKELGKTVLLTAKVQPEDATNKNVSWKSSNESVCIVSNKGELLTTGYGKTVVLATTEDGNYVGTCIVTVAEPSGIEKVTDGADVKNIARYSLDGQRLASPAKGVNIVKYSDGSVRKEIVK